ncbi:MAG: YbaK/EbsC family protein [Actinomycetota bacterium]|nr:YbaK/EbsC family protein [Actinomycetota bacterium]
MPLDSSQTDPKIGRVVEAGRALGVEVDPVIFSNETRTAADAAREVGCDVAQIVKSLVFECDGEPALFLVSGSNRLDPTRAAQVAAVGRVAKADAEMVKEVTGFSIGATPPFGHQRSLRVFMDEDLLAYDEVWAAAGRTDAVFRVSPDVLRDAVTATVDRIKSD